MQNYKTPFELETPSYGGCNTALQFSLIPPSQSPRMQNAYMDQVGDISQRPGTVPVTTTALAHEIPYLTKYKISPSVGAAEEIYAASNLVLYKYNGTNALTALTMTNALASNVLNTTGFTNSLLVSILVIGDGGILKQCNGTAVKYIVIAANDPAPAPANVLADVNTLGCKFVWEYNGHVMISPGTNEFFYTKRYEFDYVPEVQYFFLVNDNDYINGNGLAFDSVCLIPLRRSWAILTGVNFDSFAADKYLNTAYGVIAPKSIVKLTYPDGSQTIAYMSDNEAHEIFTAINDGGGRQYATRSLMKDKIDFNALGLTEAEKAAIVGSFDARRSLYLLSFKIGSTNYTYAYDVRNREWYTDWLTFNAQAYVSLDSETYFAGSTGHLHLFDNDLNSDWNESTKTTGTFVHWKRYGPAESGEFSGFPSMWDAFLVESKQWLVPATLDITFIFAGNTDVMLKIIKGEVFVEGVSEWGYAQYVNTNFTNFVNEPNEIIFEYSRLSKYVQVLMENNRDEPVKLFKQKWKGRSSGR
jgi:hypothetical protein